LTTDTESDVAVEGGGRSKSSDSIGREQEKQAENPKESKDVIQEEPF